MIWCCQLVQSLERICQCYKKPRRDLLLCFPSCNLPLCLDALESFALLVRSHTYRMFLRADGLHLRLSTTTRSVAPFFISKLAARIVDFDVSWCSRSVWYRRVFLHMNWSSLDSTLAVSTWSSYCNDVKRSARDMIGVAAGVVPHEFSDNQCVEGRGSVIVRVVAPASRICSRPMALRVYAKPKDLLSHLWLLVLSERGCKVLWLREKVDRLYVGTVAGSITASQELPNDTFTGTSVPLRDWSPVMKTVLSSWSRVYGRADYRRRGKPSLPNSVHQHFNDPCCALIKRLASYLHRVLQVTSGEEMHTITMVRPYSRLQVLAHRIPTKRWV